MTLWVAIVGIHIKIHVAVAAATECNRDKDGV